MAKLTKTQEKRFDEKFCVDASDTTGIKYKVIANKISKGAYTTGQVNAKNIKQFIADELDRQKEKFDAHLVYVEMCILEELERRKQEQKKEIIEKLEKMPIETVGNSAKTLDQAIETIKGSD